MKYLKKLQSLEERLYIFDHTKKLEAEYRAWLQKYPLGEVDGQPFNFNAWLDSLPTHLLPYFQSQLRQMLAFPKKNIG